MDSNARHIDFRRLWTLKGTEIKRKGTVAEVSNLVDKTTYRNVKYFFFSVGVNDVEYKEGAAVFADVKSLVEKITGKYDGVKVILSEITPRMDAFDERVKECNILINEYVSENENLFVARNSNLRDQRFLLADGKHLKQSASPRFASNIKWALRRAYGIRNFDKSTQRQNNFSRNGTRKGNEYGDNAPNFNLNRMWGPVPFPSRDQLIADLRKCFNL